MEESTPLRTAWGALRRHPGLWLLVLAWDLARWGLAALLGVFGLAWVRWDFYVGYQTALPGREWFARFLLPPALSSAEQLGASFGAEPPPGADWAWYQAALVPVLIMTLVEPLVRAGFLNLANGAVHGVRPGLIGFWRGVRRFGPMLVLLTAAWIGYAMFEANATARWAPALQLVLNGAVTLVFYLAQFLIITDDANPMQALPGAPFLAWTHLPSLLTPAVGSALASGALTAGLSLWGGLHPLMVIPLWAVAGTFLCLWFLAALQDGISLRNEVYGPWACRACGAQNHRGAGHCAACGGVPETTPAH